MSEYVMVHRAAYLAAMEELHAAFAATAKSNVRIAGVAGGIGIAIGCLMDGLSSDEIADMRSRFTVDYTDAD